MTILPYRSIHTDRRGRGCPLGGQRTCCGPRTGGRSSVDLEGRFLLGYRAAGQGQHPGQRFEARAETRDLGEDALGAANHPSCSHVVLGLMPRADQATIRVDAPAREVSTQMAAPPRNSEVAAVVTNRVLTSLGHRSFRNI